MEMFLLVAAAFGLIMLIMAVGVIVSNRPLRGSCGGATVFDADGTPMTCPNCSCEAGMEIDIEARHA